MPMWQYANEKKDVNNCILTVVCCLWTIDILTVNFFKLNHEIYHYCCRRIGSKNEFGIA